jgi:hypothetical protein
MLRQRAANASDGRSPVNHRALLRGARRHAAWRGPRYAARIDQLGMQATWFARMRPNSFIIGAEKCGSTALHRYLLQHPQIEGAKCKEVSYFDFNYGRGEDWYRGHFPLSPDYRRKGREAPKAIFDSTPNYLFDPRVPVRLHDFDPNAKLIVVLRDPVRRAYSHYQLMRTLGWEYLSFAAALEHEADREGSEQAHIFVNPNHVSERLGRYAYVARGLYLEQIERWLHVFERDRLLVLVSDDLNTQPADTLACAHEFLGLEPYDSGDYPTHNAGSYSAMDRDVLELLAHRFEEPNLRLSEFLNRELGWIRPT